jgi:hypothetical protein
MAVNVTGRCKKWHDNPKFAASTHRCAPPEGRRQHTRGGAVSKRSNRFERQPADPRGLNTVNLVEWPEHSLLTNELLSKSSISPLTRRMKTSVIAGWQTVRRAVPLPSR